MNAIVEVNVAPHDVRSTDWIVEAIDDDGGIEFALFSGPRAHDRAVTYRNRVYGAEKPE